jgi:hypothetical protein
MGGKEEKASGESLAELQTSTRALEDGADLNAMLEMSLAQQKAETLAHLEHQLAAALLLQSRHEVLTPSCLSLSTRYT